MERFRATCLVALLGALAGVVAVEAILLLVPSVVPTAQVRIQTAVSGPAIARGLRAQARLETVEVPIAVPVTGTVTAGIESLVGYETRDEMQFMAYGTATASVDLASIRDTDVAVLPDGTIVLTVTTELFDVWMDNQASTVVERRRNLFSRFSSDSAKLETEVRRNAEQALREVACDPHIYVLGDAARGVAPTLEKLLGLVAERAAAKPTPVRVVALPGVCRVRSG